MVDARAEADETETLAAPELGAGTNIAQDAPRDQPGDLHAGDVVPLGTRLIASVGDKVYATESVLAVLP